MKLTSSRKASKLLLAGLLFSLTGCEDDWKHVHSFSEPPRVTTDDGITWLPMRCNSTSDEWFYEPEAAVYVGDKSKNPPPGFTIDVLVHDKVWHVIKQSDGSYAFMPPTDAPDSGPTKEDVSAVLAWMMGLAGGIAAIWTHLQLARKLELIRSSDSQIQTLQSRQKRLRRQVRKGKTAFAQRWRTAEFQIENEWKKIRKEWENLEQQIRAQTVVARDTSAQEVPATPEQWKNLSLAVRAEMFRGCVPGGGIVVKYVLDPQTSGAVVFEWEITLDRPLPPSLVVSRNKIVIRRESGMFAGKFTTRLLRQNKRHIFSFELYDGEARLPDPVLLEITAPPFDAWINPPAPVQPPAAKKTSEDW